MHRFLLAAAAALVASDAAAQSATDADIRLIRTGWNDDAFAIETQQPILNPANCPTPNGYISFMSLPGYRTFYAAALTAYVAKRPVTIVVHDSECVSGTWPKLIGINLIP